MSSLAGNEETPVHLARLARELWDRESALPTATGWDSYGARESLERFVEMVKKREIVVTNQKDQVARSTLITVNRLLERMLDVDLGKRGNRKGEIPAALGLVDRADFNTQRLHRVIYRLFDVARYQTGVAGRSMDECAALVSQALIDTGIMKSLTEENAKKIYQRLLKDSPAI